MVATQQTLPGGGFEDVVYAFACERRAFKVLLRANALANILAFFGREEFFRALAHFFLRHRVVAKIFLQADQDDGDSGAAF